jgi:cytochrome c
MIPFRVVGGAALAAAFMTFGAAGGAKAADAEAGKKVFARCAVCHNIDKPATKVGPTLIGIIGRKAGSVPGFKYSDANEKSGIVWTPETLNTYLTDPKAMVPGTKMLFPGIKDDTDRANLIAYLEVASKPQ